MTLTRFKKITHFFEAKVLRIISVVLVLFSGLYLIYSAEPIAQSLPSCSDLASNVAPNVGVNCLYFGLPQCKDVSLPQHRVNCADLIDLPLCSDIVSGNPVNPGRNCVNLCSNSAYTNPDPTASPALVRGVDYAIFNKDCLRFCDELETGITANPGVNCANRKCHQVGMSVTPIDGGNCNLLDCNLLTPDELNKSKFGDETKKYCNGDIRCYNFTQLQLPYMRVRANNPTCKIHKCAPPTGSTNCGANDTLNVTNQGTAYTAAYQTYINAGFNIASNTVCEPINCRPIVKTSFRCTTNGVNISGDDTKDTVRNNLCDATGDGSVCSSNYCFLSTDCNAAGNSAKTECLTATSTPPINGVDPFDSWFYRPKPMDKATQGGGIIRSNMRDDFCYEQGAMEDNGWGKRLEIDLGFLGTIDLGWFEDYLIDDTRSPGSCSGPHQGFRGTNYGYLCGTNLNIFERPDDYTIYFKGYASTDFSGAVPQHKVTVCLRFTNTSILKACGSRECGIFAMFSDIIGQNCGSDVCRELIIPDSGTSCNMNNGSGLDASCTAEIDQYLRVRAVKYNNNICAFLDSKGQVAYNNMFFDGSETLNDGKTCINDTGSTGAGGCNGYNSNSTKAQADQWRTILKAHYVDNNRPNGPRGYLDKSGKLYPEQECPNITLRIPPPDLYNLANSANSIKLFIPPLYIRSVSIIRGGSDSVPPAGAQFGKTDFHYPEIKVQFGTTIHSLSLGLGYTGYESSGNTEDYTASPSSKTITTVLNGRTYSADLFVRKEYSENNSIPIFCLYRKVSDVNGVSLDPVKISCVERESPAINNAADRMTNPTLPGRRVIVAPKAGNQYNNAKLTLQYLASFGANNVDNNCSGDDSCSQKLEFNNAPFGEPECSLNLESHKICVERDECSKLNIECIQNELDLRDAQLANQSTASFEAIRDNCTKNLLPYCNMKKGIVTSSQADVYNQNPDGAVVDNNAYGWFNELCVVKGFEKKLNNIISRRTASGIKGKCLIDPNSPYLTDGNSATNCDSGGFAPNCLCINAPEGYPENSNEVVRKQTPREAGLCIDMPTPQKCAPINHNPIPNPDTNDLDYIIHSLNKNSYNDSTGVHISHQYRSIGKPAPDAIPVAGHAEFSVALIGMNDSYGECQGYWTYQKNSVGVDLKPTMSCLNVNGNPTWETSARNACVRYTCPDILTTGPNELGVYQGNYGDGESGEDIGKKNGYATWSKYTKTNDFAESANAISCIAGYKPAGSTAVISNGAIVRYSGGTAPSRMCNQIGQWQTPVNSCVRISCPAINPTVPTSSDDAAAWNQWYDSGGATYPTVFASRSTVRAQSGSVAYGTCNESLGFFKSPGAVAPSRNCDSLGNWGPVMNPCVTSCSAITSDSEASNLSNGYAKWDAVTDAGLTGEKPGVFTGSVTGYVPNPYPPTQDIYGNDLPASVANDLTRPAESPKRLCKSSIVNFNCPGAVIDAVNGKTTHSTSSGNITISWPSGDLGKYSYVTNWGGVASQFSSLHFNQNRTNGYYLLRRYCNLNGTWSAAEPVCAANGGVIGNAYYLKTNANTGYDNSIAINSEDIAGTCVTGAWKANRNSGDLPIRQCLFLDAANYIDQVYLGLKAGSNDCEAVTCQLNYNQEIGNSKYGNSGNNFFAIGATANLTCKSGYGKKIASPASSRSITNNESDLCNVDDYFTTTDRILSEPSATCGIDGQWTVQNDCNVCRSCSDNSPVQQNIIAASDRITNVYLADSCVAEEACLRRLSGVNGSVYYGSGINYGSGQNCNATSGGLPLNIDNFTIAHLATKSAVATKSDSCGSGGAGDICGAVKVKCYDNRIISKMNSVANGLACSPNNINF